MTGSGEYPPTPEGSDVGRDPADNSGLFDWFDGVTSCPDCGHTCFDLAACRELEGCTCHHICHFGVLPASEVPNAR
jgi:hypothetical protein